MPAGPPTLLLGPPCGRWAWASVWSLAAVWLFGLYIIDRPSILSPSVVVGSSTSSTGPPRRRRVLGIVDGSSTSSTGPPHRRQVLRIVDGSSASSIGPSASPMGCPHHRQVLRIINWRIIDGPSVSSLGLRVVDGRPHLSCGLVLHLHHCWLRWLFSSSRCCVPRCWAARSLLEPLPPRCAQFVVEGLRNRALASHVVVGFPSLAVAYYSSSLGCVPRCWGSPLPQCAALVVMGSWSVRVFFFTWFATSVWGTRGVSKEN